MNQYCGIKTNKSDIKPAVQKKNIKSSAIQLTRTFDFSKGIILFGFEAKRIS